MNKCDCVLSTHHKDNKYDVIGAEDYCIDQMIAYPHHDIEPVWCEDCGYLEYYLVKVNPRGSAHIKPRNDDG